MVLPRDDSPVFAPYGSAVKHQGSKARHKPSYTWCDQHYKHGFHHKKAAKRVARETDHSVRMSVFWCDHVGAWHVGHLHAGIKLGIYSRDDLLNR